MSKYPISSHTVGQACCHLTFKEQEYVWTVWPLVQGEQIYFFGLPQYSTLAGIIMMPTSFIDFLASGIFLHLHIFHIY